VFELYTERARRVIFFARYEASQFGSMNIATEHLLLGLLREHNHIVSRFLPSGPSADDLRKEIQNRVKAGNKIPTTIDLPLSDECKRILACANEEKERLVHLNIDTEHILLGILRERNCLAADILQAHGLTLNDARKAVAAREGVTFLATGVGLLATLDAHGFDAPLQNLAQAREAAQQQDWKVARSKLQLALDSLVTAIREKLQGDESVFEGLDWQDAIRGLNNTGLAPDEDWYFHWRLTLLLAEVLVKRFDQRMA